MEELFEYFRPLNLFLPFPLSVDRFSRMEFLSDDAFGLSPLFALDNTEVEVRSVFGQSSTSVELCNFPPLVLPVVHTPQRGSSEIQQHSEVERVGTTRMEGSYTQPPAEIQTARRERRSRGPRMYTSRIR
jgi:hypothetical protein